MRISLAFGCALVLATFVPVSGQDAKVRSFPLYLNVEGEYVRTTGVLRLPWVAYPQSIATLSSASSEEDERIFLRFVQSVQANDVKALERVLVSPPVPKGETTVATPPRSPTQLLGMYTTALGSLKDLQLEGRVGLDRASLFIWSAPAEKGRLIRGTSVRTIDGRRGAAEVTMADPLETFIVNSLNRIKVDEMRNSGSTVSPSMSTQVIPLTKSGVELRFTGAISKVTIPSASSASSPLVTLTERVRASQNKDVSRLLALHTPKSTAKLKQWLDTMNTRARADYLADQARARDVKLILDGGPVLLVFSAPQASDGSSTGDVRYDYLVRDGAAYKIANVLYSSFFDDLLKNTTAVSAFLQPKGAVQP